MKRLILNLIVGATVSVGVFCFSAPEAQAGWWGSCGSWGGWSSGWSSWGGYGCYGYGSGWGHGYGGGGWHDGYCGWGGYYGGSYGWGHGHDGYHDGAYYAAPTYYGHGYDGACDWGHGDALPVIPPTEDASPSDGETLPMPSNSAAASKRATMNIRLPAEAKLYVNDYLTKSSGEQRQYEWRDLRPGKVYSLEVRAEMVRNGQTIENTQHMTIRGGETQELAFEFRNPLTTLTLNVPDDASVFLAAKVASTR